MLRFLPDTIISFLPNVKTLSLDLPAAVLQPWTVHQADASFRRVVGISLQVLPSLSIGCSTGLGLHAEDLALFFTLPRLKAIDIYGCEDVGVLWRIKETSSPVTSLKLMQSHMTPATVKNIIRVCKNLEVFEYTQKYKTKQNAKVQPSKLVRYLCRFAETPVSLSCNSP